MDLSIIPNYIDILGKLHLAWTAVQASKSLCIVLIEGESGMKKSTLVRRFLESSTGNYIIGHGSGIPSPYLPLRMACESMLQLDSVQVQLKKEPETVSKEWKIALTNFAQALGVILTADDPVWELLAQWRKPSLDSSIAGDDLGEGEIGRLKPVNLPELFTCALGELTRLSPVIAFMNNLDVTDIPTIESLTRNVIPMLEDSPLLFIATFEPGAGNTEAIFDEFVETVRQLPGTQYLKLEPLQEEHIHQLLTSPSFWWIRGETEERIQALAARIHALTGGNFSQVQDLLFWHENEDEKDIYEILETVPDFYSFLQKKFAQIAEEEKIFLQMAASQGLYFCLPVVAKALGYAEIDMKAILSKVTSKPGGWIGGDTVAYFGSCEFTWYRFLGRFRHELAYYSIPEHVRRVYHRKIAEALEKVYHGHVSIIAELLATQFDLAASRNKAAFYQAMAAHCANEQGDFSKGLEFAQKGLENLGKCVDIPENLLIWCRLMIEKGRAMHTTGHGLMAEKILRETYKAAEDLPDTTLRMDAGRYLGHMLLERNNWDEGICVIVQSITLAIEQKKWIVVIDGIETLRDRFRRCGYTEAFFDICKMLIDMMETEVKEITTNSPNHLPCAQKDISYTSEENFENILQRLEQAHHDSSPRGELTEQANVVLAETLHSRGWLHYQLSENEKALEDFGKALRTLEQLEHLERYAETYYKIHRGRAEVYLRIDDFSQSLQEVEKAMRWADVSYQRKNQALIRSAKVAVLRLMGRIEEGEQELESALGILKSSSWLATIGDVERDYGFFLYNTGDEPHAKTMYQKSREHYETAGDFDQMQGAMLHLAVLDQHQGAFQKALATYQQVLSKAIVQNDKVSQSICHDRLGEIYRIQGYIGNAEQSHLNAIQLSDTTHNMGAKAIALRSLGQVHLVNWDLLQAQVLFIQSDLFYQAHVGPEIQHHRTILFLGRVALSQHDMAEAFTAFDAVQKFFETVHDLFWLSMCAVNQGLAYLMIGEVETSLLKAQHALEFFQGMESWRIGDAYHLLARCYLAAGQLNQAQSSVEQAERHFMMCKLFHRIYQAENTELLIDKAYDTEDLEKYRIVDPNELRVTFNHLGV